MLTNWLSRDSYCSFLSSGVDSLSPADSRRLSGLFSSSLEKLTSLNLDPVMEMLSLHYSSIGRPVLYQTQILRSFILMLDSGKNSIKNWIKTLHSDHLMALLIGCDPENCPSLGFHYDLIDRLWLRSRSLDMQKRREQHRCNFFTKLKKVKLKKGIWGCKCERRYADPDARWGWDSSKEQWFYGHEIYLLSCYNPDLKVDLPL